MRTEEIKSYLERRKKPDPANEFSTNDAAVVWVSNRNGFLNPVYPGKDVIAIVESFDIAYELCDALRTLERSRHGKVGKRYAISTRTNYFVLYEDPAAEEHKKSIRNMPTATADITASRRMLDIQ
jgi:hypothetical protein